jgi:WD40 repeat protein
MLLLQGSAKHVNRIEFAPDSRRLVAATNTSVEVWEDIAPHRQPSRTLDFVPSGPIRFTPDGQKLLFTAYLSPHPRTGRPRPAQHVVVLHDLVSCETETLVHEGDYASATCDCTPDGRFLVMVVRVPSFPPLLVTNQPETTISCRPMNNLRNPLWTIETSRPVAGPLVLPGGANFVLFERVAPVNLVTRETATGRILAEIRFPGFAGTPVLSADGRWLVTRHDNQVVVFHGKNYAGVPIVLENDSRKQFTGLAFHPSGRFLAATSTDATVKLYDTETWKAAQVFTWEIGRMRSIAFSPDGMLAAAGSNKGQIIVWDFDL